ncbi:MAG: hypothetical protein K6E63_01035 [Lachnospiraceae bacterium]|nr:hypothetical protein [Lachnospiraceae bacterium]
MLLNTLKAEGIEVLCPDLTDEATTTLAFVTLDETGDRSFTFARKPGAGDAYWGGFLSSLLKQGVKSTADLTMDKLTAAGRYGAVSGALCIQKPGGIPAMPYHDEIEKYL